MHALRTSGSAAGGSRRLWAAFLAVLALCSSLAMPAGAAWAGSYQVQTDANGCILNEQNGDNVAYNEKDPYLRFDTGKMFADDGSSENALFTGVSNILRSITTYLLLPIGIIFVTWRCGYIATLVYIAHIDPLHMVFDAQGQIVKRYVEDKSYNATLRRRGAFDWGSGDSFYSGAWDPKTLTNQERVVNDYLKTRNKLTSGWEKTWNSAAKRALIIEAKTMGIGLFVVFAVWSLLNVMIWLAMILLDML